MLARSPALVVYLTLAPLLSATPAVTAAQQLPFRVTIIDWDPATLGRLRRAFRSEAAEREVLFCVESWMTTSPAIGIDRVVITAVRRERSGAKHGIDDVAADCIDEEGRSLPMFHTHSEGNCQLSPSDLVTLVARGAPFEGVQCGERHFVWAFAWQVALVAATVELGGVTHPRAPAPATYPVLRPPPRR